MDDVKKRLKILLRPGEPEKRPDLTWPKSMKKEPVEVVKEVIELLSSFRDTMKRNFETVEVSQIQERWCVCLLSGRHSTECALGVVVTSHGYSENDGRSCLKISVTLSQRNSTRPEYVHVVSVYGLC